MYAVLWALLKRINHFVYRMIVGRLPVFLKITSNHFYDFENVKTDGTSNWSEQSSWYPLSNPWIVKQFVTNSPVIFYKSGWEHMPIASKQIRLQWKFSHVSIQIDTDWRELILINFQNANASFTSTQQFFHSGGWLRLNLKASQKHEQLLHYFQKK